MNLAFVYFFFSFLLETTVKWGAESPHLSPVSAIASSDTRQSPRSFKSHNLVNDVVRQLRIYSTGVTPVTPERSLRLHTRAFVETGRTTNLFINKLKFFPKTQLSVFDVVKTASESSPISIPSSPRIVVIGAPSSGKGTLCQMLADRLGVVHVSAGSLLRDRARENTEEGRQLHETLSAGRLVSDDLISSIVLSRIQQEDCRKQGWTLDGFPRTEGQSLHISTSCPPDLILYLDTSDQLLIDRALSRREDPQTGIIYNLLTKPPPTEEISERCIMRSDDTREVCVERIETFRRMASSVMAALTHPERLVYLDTSGTPDQIFEALFSRVTVGSPPQS